MIRRCAAADGMTGPLAASARIFVGPVSHNDASRRRAPRATAPPSTPADRRRGGAGAAGPSSGQAAPVSPTSKRRGTFSERVGVCAHRSIPPADLKMERPAAAPAGQRTRGSTMSHQRSCFLAQARFAVHEEMSPARRAPTRIRPNALVSRVGHSHRPGVTATARSGIEPDAAACTRSSKARIRRRKWSRRKSSCARAKDIGRCAQGVRVWREIGDAVVGNDRTTKTWRRQVTAGPGKPCILATL